MKHPKPDIKDTLLAEFISNTSTIRKLLRYWGTESIDGVTVLKQRQYYYPMSSSKNLEKLLRFLGVYDDMKSSDMEGVENAWLYINKNKENVVADTPETTEFILHNLNLLWWDPEDGPQPPGLTLTAALVIGEGLRLPEGSEPSGATSFNPEWDLSELKGFITANYEDIWSTRVISQHGVGVINKGSITEPVTKVVTPDNDDLSPNDPWMQTLVRYALRTGGISYTVKNIERGLVSDNYQYSTSYILTVELPYTVFTADMPIVTSIVNDFIVRYNPSQTGYTNGYYTKQALLKLSIADLELDDTVVTRPYLPWEATSTGQRENIWYKIEGYSATRFNRTYNVADQYMLKADALQHPRDYGLTYKELVAYLLPLIDSDYTKKKARWWMKLIAVVVFIIAVILAKFTMGGSLALAKAILVGVLVVSALSVVLSKMGATEWALAFAEVSKMVQPLAWIASIILIVVPLGQAISAANAAASAGGAAGSVAEATVAQMLRKFVIQMADDFVQSLVQGAQELFTGQLTSSSINLLTKMLKLFSHIQELKLEAIQDRNQDLQAKYEKMEEDAELENDILRGFSQVYASPATADWSMYAGLFDLPYEGTGGALHIGNCQRTTKQALRKAKYDDPSFNGILII